ncbi:MAG: hypothetical protein GY862_33325, partial [Gammaproteobacteria bacterium]|nr:hypothetical protein [Gammaproteobacteria bacterium]
TLCISGHGDALIYTPTQERGSEKNGRDAGAWEREKEFEKKRAQGLIERLIYAQRELGACENFAQTTEFRALLEALLAYQDINELRDYARLPVLAETPAAFRNKDSAWMAGGWHALKKLCAGLADLERYRELKDAGSRQAFLGQKLKQLQAHLPKEGSYWDLLGAELTEHWIELLERERKQAREWLDLKISLPKQNLRTGRQTLLLDIANTSGVLAGHVGLHLEKTSGLHWPARDIEQRFIEAGEKISMRVQVESDQAGAYTFGGHVDAEDPEETPFRKQFSFSLPVGEAGRPYRLPDTMPYVAGPGLDEDRVFAGRGELLHWLRGLWRQFRAKPAVVLVGQRRIGKTSLLRKILRERWENLLPLYINIQGVTANTIFSTIRRGKWPDP